MSLPDLVNAVLDSEGHEQTEAIEQLLDARESTLGGWGQEVIDFLRQRFQVELDKHPANSEPNVEADELGLILNGWNAIGVNAALHGRVPEAEALFRELLSILRRNQLRLGRLHKGTPLHELGWLRLRNDAERATPYILAALIEDVIRDPAGFKSGPAAQVSVNVLGLDPSFLDDVQEFVEAEVPGPREVQELAEFDPELLSLVRSMNDPPSSQLLRISLHYDPAIGDLLLGAIE